MSNSRVYNFSAGPAVLPLPVLQQAQKELVSLPGVGMSVLEVSHRGEAYTAIHRSAQDGLRQLLRLPDNYRILFLQGGSRLQFCMVPMNFLADGTADYVDTGTWSTKAIKEAEGYKVGRVNRAEGDVSAFLAVLAEYRKAPEVTRKRLYLEAMEEILALSTAGQRSSSDEEETVPRTKNEEVLRPNVFTTFGDLSGGPSHR